MELLVWVVMDPMEVEVVVIHIMQHLQQQLSVLHVIVFGGVVELPHHHEWFVELEEEKEIEMEHHDQVVQE